MSLFTKKRTLKKLCSYKGTKLERYERITVLLWEGKHIYFGLHCRTWYLLDLTESDRQDITFFNQVQTNTFLLLESFLNDDRQISIVLEKTQGYWVPLE